MPHSTWTWQRTTASVVAVLLGLRLLPEVLTSFRGSIDPFALLFLAVPMLLLFGCVLFVFLVRRIHMDSTDAAHLTIGTTFLFRVLTIQFNWSSRPVMQYGPPPSPPPLPPS